MIITPSARAPICYERYAEVPATLERFTRFEPDQDGVLETTRGQDPI